MNENIISCPKSLENLTDTIKIFCAGPIQGAPDWQHSLPEINGVTWICPRRDSYDGFDYDQQTSWETLGLRISDAVMFWIPAPEKEIPGRGYAQTTRIEFGECLGRGKKIFIGIYPDYNGRKYFQNKLSEYEAQELHENLDSLLREIKDWVDIRRNSKDSIFFTSDTHFSSQRALELSKRPFRNTQDMDWTIIERWNKIVPPGSTVFHLGDFGELWPLHYLNGNIKFILGNYEESGKTEIPPVDVLGKLWHQKMSGLDIWMSHRPLSVKKFDGMSLFGHIHGRQKVKPWGGLDVGVDCNNFSPISLDEVKFFWNAIEKGYYDEDVWS